MVIKVIFILMVMSGASGASHSHFYYTSRNSRQVTATYKWKLMTKVMVTSLLLLYLFLTKQHFLTKCCIADGMMNFVYVCICRTILTFSFHEQHPYHKPETWINMAKDLHCFIVAVKMLIVVLLVLFYVIIVHSKVSAVLTQITSLIRTFSVYQSVFL